MENFCDGLNEEIVVKFRSKTDRVFDDVATNTNRNDAIRYIGRTKHELYVLFEKPIPN